ncbi:MAG TPA: hypothetical protein VGR19_04030 [Allosphingosinicella sp.]|nr:hypothetical protein [Allosphingosinicella sp.]
MLFTMLLLAALQDAKPIFPSAPVNADFEQPAPANAPAGWKAFGEQGYRFERVDGPTGKAGRLISIQKDDVQGPSGASLFQNIDATEYRGKIVRLRASVKVVRPGTHVGLGMRVVRPQPKFAGFADMMKDRPIHAGGWETQEIVGRVAPDAEHNWIGLSLSGDAHVLVDEVTLEAIEPDPRPPSKEAVDYL